VLTEHPDVTWLGDRRLGDLRYCILIGQTVLGLLFASNQRLPFLGGKASEAKVKARVLQLGQLDAKQFVLPRCVLTNLVVGQDQCAALGVGEVLHGHHGNLGKTEFACSQQPTMAGNDVVRAIDQDGCTPAKLTNAGGDLSHLSVGMLLGIARIGDQRIDRAVFEFDGVHEGLK